MIVARATVADTVKTSGFLAKLMARPRPPQVLQVSGPIVIEFPDGTRIQIGPAAAGRGPARGQLARPASASEGKAGRKPGPATQALVAAMKADAESGRPRSRSEYLALLRDNGHTGSDNSAALIVTRESKRVFGHSLGQRKEPRARARGGRRGRGPSPETVLLRAKLQEDRAAGDLRDARHYLGWLMAQPKVQIGLKPARPIVYRELRSVR